jgi:hypothetical protein
LPAKAGDPEAYYRDHILPHKLALYEEYVRTRSFCGDIYLILKTIMSVLFPKYSVIILIFFAMIDELHQSFIPSRTFLLSDVAIDSAGGIFAQVAIVFRKKTIRYYKES